jgi:hypothetical protein
MPNHVRLTPATHADPHNGSCPTWDKAIPVGLHCRCIYGEGCDLVPPSQPHPRAPPRALSYDEEPSRGHRYGEGCDVILPLLSQPHSRAPHALNADEEPSRGHQMKEGSAGERDETILGRDDELRRGWRTACDEGEAELEHDVRMTRRRGCSGIGWWRCSKEEAASTAMTLGP